MQQIALLRAIKDKEAMGSKIMQMAKTDTTQEETIVGKEIIQYNHLLTHTAKVVITHKETIADNLIILMHKTDIIQAEIITGNLITLIDKADITQEEIIVGKIIIHTAKALLTRKQAVDLLVIQVRTIIVITEEVSILETTDQVNTQNNTMVAIMVDLELINPVMGSLVMAKMAIILISKDTVQIKGNMVLD